MALWMAVAAVMILFYGQWHYFRTHWKNGLSVQLQFAKKGVSVGEFCSLEEIVSNAKRMPLPALQVKFQTSATFRFAKDQNASVTDHYYRTDLFAVGKNQRITRTLDFVPTRRGYYEIETSDVLVRDYFFTSQYSVRYPNQTGLYVYPAKRDVKRFSLLYRRMSGELLAKRRMEEDPFAFRGMREYRSTDSMRRINWKSSVKQGKLLVNLYESSFSQEICILLDGSCRWAGEKQELLEGAISIASSVAALLLRQGVPVSLASNLGDCLNGEAVCCKAGAGRRHLQEIDRGLARIDTDVLLQPFPMMVQQEIAEKASRATTGGWMDAQICYLLVTADPTEKLHRMAEEYIGQGICMYGILLWHETEPESWDGFLNWRV